MPSEDAIRVVGYCRVSTDHQADGGVSLAAQQAKIEAYCDLYSLQLVGLHIDAGVSAKSLKRPALSAALAELQAGTADGLLVTKLDRLTRSVIDIGRLIQDYFNEHQLISVAERIDTSSASGRMMLNLLMTISQWEREVIGERTVEAMAHLKHTGVKVGRAGYGWRYTGELDASGRKLLEPVNAEVETLERIHELRAEGMTMSQIANVLTAENRPTKRRGRWHSGTVSKVLKRTPRESAQTGFELE